MSIAAALEEIEQNVIDALATLTPRQIWAVEVLNAIGRYGRDHALASEHVRAQVAYSESGIEAIRIAYPMHQLQRTYSVGADIYAMMLGPEGTMILVTFRRGKVCGPNFA